MDIMMSKFKAANANIELIYARLLKICDATEYDIVTTVLEEQIKNETDIIKTARLNFLYNSILSK